MDHDGYTSAYGPTTGDRVRLGDTNLVIEVERDCASHGDELLPGCGKTAQAGMLVQSRDGADTGLDLVIGGALIVDPVLGVLKGDIGVKEGRIVGIGRAGNPDVMDGPDLIVGPHTSLIPGAGLIATPGGVDSHVHLSAAAVVPVILGSGVTTIVGMGSGGVWDIGVNPERHLRMMLAAWREFPVNAAFLARGGYDPRALEQALAAGASGFKIHEDFGGTPAIIDRTLRVAEQADVAVAMHTDTLNEAGSLTHVQDAETIPMAVLIIHRADVKSPAIVLNVNQEMRHVPANSDADVGRVGMFLDVVQGLLRDDENGIRHRGLHSQVALGGALQPDVVGRVRSFPLDKLLQGSQQAVILKGKRAEAEQEIADLMICFLGEALHVVQLGGHLLRLTDDESASHVDRENQRRKHLCGSVMQVAGQLVADLLFGRYDPIMLIPKSAVEPSVLDCGCD